MQQLEGNKKDEYIDDTAELYNFAHELREKNRKRAFESEPLKTICLGILIDTRLAFVISQIIAAAMF